MKTVNIISANEPNANFFNHYNGTYLHGELEEETGFDLFCFDREVKFDCGKTEVLIEVTDRVATFFLWAGEKGWYGLLVYNDDEKFQECVDCYDRKEENL